MSSKQRRKSQALGLSFAYDWSNPDIPDDALILNVLKRGIYEDICKIARHYGLERVEALGARSPETMDYWLMQRMMSNLKSGFAQAQQSGNQEDMAQPSSGPLPAAEQAEFEALALQIHRRTRRQDVIGLMRFMQRGKTLQDIYDAAAQADASCSPAAADCVLTGLAPFDQGDESRSEPSEEEMREAFAYFAAAINSREVETAIRVFLRS